MSKQTMMAPAEGAAFFILKTIPFLPIYSPADQSWGQVLLDLSTGLLCVDIFDVHKAHRSISFYYCYSDT